MYISVNVSNKGVLIRKYYTNFGMQFSAKSCDIRKLGGVRRFFHSEKKSKKVSAPVSLLGFRPCFFVGDAARNSVTVGLQLTR